MKTKNKYLSVPVIAVSCLSLVMGLSSCQKDSTAAQPGDAAVDSSQAMGEYMEDAVITARIKAMLIKDDFLTLAPINVTTVNGVVTLTGTVDSEALAARATGLVNSQSDVISSDNQLKIKTSEQVKP